MDQIAQPLTTSPKTVLFFTEDNSFSILDDQMEYLLTVHDHSGSTKPPLPNPIGKQAQIIFPPQFSGSFPCPKEGLHQVFLVSKDFSSEKFPLLRQLQQDLKVTCGVNSSDITQFFSSSLTRIRYNVTKQDPIKPGEILHKGYRFFSDNKEWQLLSCVILLGWN